LVEKFPQSRVLHCTNAPLSGPSLTVRRSTHKVSMTQFSRHSLYRASSNSATTFHSCGEGGSAREGRKIELLIPNRKTVGGIRSRLNLPALAGEAVELRSTRAEGGGRHISGAAN
jgi:hypothetical protein